MSSPGEHRTEEPQQERGAPGSRDTGSDQPAGGPADRPSGEYQGDESVPKYEGGEKPEFEARTTNQPPGDSERVLPPYDDRQQAAKPEGGSTKAAGARTGGATEPTSDPDYKAPPPGATPGGTTASPAQEQPASETPETNRDDDTVGPAHTTGTGRAEDKR